LRLARADHTALHAALAGVERQSREDRRVELGPVRPDVLSPDQTLVHVVGRDDDAVVGNGVDQHLVEAVVDTLGAERLAEIASGSQQQPGLPGSPDELLAGAPVLAQLHPLTDTPVLISTSRSLPFCSRAAAPGTLSAGHRDLAEATGCVGVEALRTGQSPRED